MSTTRLKDEDFKMYEIPCSEWTSLSVSEHAYTVAAGQGFDDLAGERIVRVFVKLRHADESGPPCGNGESLAEALDDVIEQQRAILAGLESIRQRHAATKEEAAP